MKGDGGGGGNGEPPKAHKHVKGVIAVAGKNAKHQQGAKQCLNIVAYDQNGTDEQYKEHHADNVSRGNAGLVRGRVMYPEHERAGKGHCASQNDKYYKEGLAEQKAPYACQFRAGGLLGQTFYFGYIKDIFHMTLSKQQG